VKIAKSISVWFDQRKPGPKQLWTIKKRKQTIVALPPQRFEIFYLDPLSIFFFMVQTQFGLRNPNCTNTNSEHVCNMDSHF